MRQGAGGQERGQAFWRAKGANPQAPSPSPHPPQNEHKAPTHTHTHIPASPPARHTAHPLPTSARSTLPTSQRRRLLSDVSATTFRGRFGKISIVCTRARTPRHATHPTLPPWHAPHARTPRADPTRTPRPHPTHVPHERTPRTHPTRTPPRTHPKHAPHSRIPRTHTTHAHHATPCRATHAPHACTNAHTHARTPRAHAHVHAHAHAHMPPLRPNLLLWSTSRRTNWWRRALVKLVLRCTLGRSVLGLF